MSALTGIMNGLASAYNSPVGQGIRGVAASPLTPLAIGVSGAMDDDPEGSQKKQALAQLLFMGQMMGGLQPPSTGGNRQALTQMESQVGIHSQQQGGQAKPFLAPPQQATPTSPYPRIQ